MMSLPGCFGFRCIWIPDFAGMRIAAKAAIRERRESSGRSSHRFNVRRAFKNFASRAVSDFRLPENERVALSQ